uniref:Uncharacterized protein n=1 Tax=Anguilla anguilla TaxID=7936 RepID=A0A0E9RHI1_ANGAN
MIKPLLTPLCCSKATCISCHPVEWFLPVPRGGTISPFLDKPLVHCPSSIVV